MGEGGLVGGLFTWGEFTGEVFTVQSVVLRLTAGPISADGVPGRWDSVGCSNIDTRGSQSLLSMIGSM